MISTLTTLFAIHRRFGFGSMLRYFLDRVGKRLLKLQVIEVVWLSAAGIQLPDMADSRLEFRFLTPGEVAEFAKDPANQLDQEMVDRAAAGMDLCFAIVSDGRLASYGWYALQGIEARHNFGVTMIYPPSVAYMYKGFTHRDFRGQRLHGLGMKHALFQLERRGVNALLSTVDWTNSASMRSCDRLGYRRLGILITVGNAPGRVVRVPRAALRRGVQFNAPGTVRPTPPVKQQLPSVPTQASMACETRLWSK